MRTSSTIWWRWSNARPRRSTPNGRLPQQPRSRGGRPPSLRSLVRRTDVSALQPVRGTHDILPDELPRHRGVVERGRGVAERYGYLEMATPIFEFTEVFRRPLGETSDVVSKEMYSFADRGGEELTLRPEATAAGARAFLSAGLTHELPCKFFCHGPMFRYDRPQKGRQRQFHQINVELLGVAEPLGDVEMI